MESNRDDLLDDLRQRTERIIQTVQTDFSKLNTDRLKQRPSVNQWGVLDCLEHLNIFADFYLPEIEKSIEASPDSAENSFKSGWFGNWVAESMRITDQPLKKMKTAAGKNPINHSVSDQTITRFLKQQDHLLELIDQSHRRNLTNVKVSTDIVSFIKMRLGDILRFVVYHNERHLEQAKRALENQ
ncbi:MAG: DinB family protein [Calditrichaeota bacterium]|nr:DinB family protein [Calditrichota bacterium]